MLEWHATTFAKRFDPRSKTITYLLISVIIIASTRFIPLLILAGGLLGMVLLAGLVRPWLRVCRVLLPTIGLFVLIVALATDLLAGLAAGLRLVDVVLAGTLFFGTTAPEALGEALVATGLRPQIAFVLEGTLRFVPTMGRLMREVRDAQASRGLRFDGVYLLRNGVMLLGPLLVSALHVADDLAEALEARGFAHPRHTTLVDYHLKLHDWALMSTTLVVTGAIWFLGRLS